MTILGGIWWDDDNIVQTPIWEDDRGLPVPKDNPYAVKLKYDVGDVITDADKIAINAVYYQPRPDGQFVRPYLWDGPGDPPYPLPPNA